MGFGATVGGGARACCCCGDGRIGGGAMAADGDGAALLVFCGERREIDSPGRGMVAFCGWKAKKKFATAMLVDDASGLGGCGGRIGRGAVVSDTAGLGDGVTCGLGFGVRGRFAGGVFGFFGFGMRSRR